MPRRLVDPIKRGQGKQSVDARARTANRKAWTGVVPAATVGPRTAPAAQVPPECHPRLSPISSRRYHVVGARPADDPVRLQRAACRRRLSGRLPRRLAARRRGAPALGGRLRRRAVRRRRGARRAADDGAFPARLSRRQPRALRARPAHVRRAGCRPSPTPARCGSRAASARSRASSPTGRRSTAAGSASTRACGASSGSTSPITGRCASSSTAPRAPSATRS